MGMVAEDSSTFDASDSELAALAGLSDWSGDDGDESSLDEDSSSKPGCCDGEGEDEELLGTGSVIQDKMIRWGAFEKDWTSITELEKYFRTQPDKGITMLKGLVESLEQGTSIEEFEKGIPPSGITNFYWSTKKDLERLAGKKVMLLLGFCPQYKLMLDADSVQVAPENTECLTQLVLSWLSLQSNGLLLAWDFRHDCRKAVQKCMKCTTYANCASVDNLKVETEHLNYLSYILLLVAQKLYSVQIQGTISFSSCTNRFVKVLDVPHIALSEHISRIWMRHSLAVDLVKAMVESRFYGNQRWEELYESLSAHLLLGPGRESGRVLVRLTPVEIISKTLITFDELISARNARKEYGRTRSVISRRRTKLREATDPKYAKQRVVAVRGYKEKDYAKLKKMRVEAPVAYAVKLNHKSELQKARRAKTPGYAKAHNDKVAKKRLDDPEFDEAFKKRKKGIDKKHKDKVRGKN